MVMAFVGFGAFAWMVRHGWSEASARKVLLLLMVLFENVHTGNCRSETKSALRLSPLRSPMLLAGALTAPLIHVAMLDLPLRHAVLTTEPVGPRTWAVLLALALTVFVAMEVHTGSWRRRGRRSSPSAG